MKHIGLFILTICISAAAVRAQETGTFSFLRNEIGARASAMNGSFVSMSDDPNLIFYNPGGLATISRSEASAGFLKHLLDVNGGYLSYARPMEGIGTLAAGIIYMDYGSFDQTDESMNVLGTFSARDLALVVGIGRSLDEVTSIGLNAKLIYSSIVEFKSSGIALDAGVLVQDTFSEYFHWGERSFPWNSAQDLRWHKRVASSRRQSRHHEAS